MLKKLLILAAALALPKLADAAEVGLLVAVKGDVQTFRPSKNKWSKASLMESVADGGKIKVAPGGEAVITLYKNGERRQLGPGSVTTVAADACKTASGPAAITLPALPMKQIKDLAQSRVAVGRPGGTVLRGGPLDIELLGLFNTATRDRRPVFRWRAVAGAASYKLKVWDEKDDQIWQAEAVATSATYPADAPELKPGVDYIWRVTATVKGERFSANGIFRVLTHEQRVDAADELQTLPDGDDAVTQVLRAEFFVRRGLWDDAIAAYQSLAAAHPESAAIHSALANLLAEQGRYAQSRAEMKK